MDNKEDKTGIEILVDEHDKRVDEKISTEQKYRNALKEIRKALDGVQLFAPAVDEQREVACLSIHEILEDFGI